MKMLLYLVIVVIIGITSSAKTYILELIETSRLMDCHLHGCVKILKSKATLLPEIYLLHPFLSENVFCEMTPPSIGSRFSVG